MKVLVQTFGCRANHYDSERVRALAIGAGHELVDDAGEADLAVFNSCAVTTEAERDVRKAVRRVAQRNPRVRSVVMGCAAGLATSRDALRVLPTVEHVVAGADLDALRDILGAGIAPSLPPVIPGAAGDLHRQSTVRAVLRVQDGCDEHCTFCATTLARGNNRSRGVEELVAEATRLAEHHPEIVITGTHIGSYGLDTERSLGALLQRLVRDVPRARFRLSSIEATEVDDALRELLRASDGRVTPHLHAPLQSGSDRILKRMGRHWYTAGEYVAAVEGIVDGRAVFGLGADVIVGFPGETDEDFALTEAIVQQLPFTYLHVFTYSPRPGTAATRLPDPVPLSDAHARSHRLRHLAQEKGNAYRGLRAGGSADAIVITGGVSREVMTEDYLTLPYTGGDRPRGDRFRADLRLESGSLTAVQRR